MTAKAMPPWKRQMVKWSIVGIVLSLLVIVMLGGEPDDAPTPTPTIASIGEEIVFVGRTGDLLNITVSMKPQSDEAGAIFNAAGIVLKAMKQIKAGASDAGGPGLQTLQLSFSVPTQNALGQEDRSSMMTIQISGEDLAASVPDKMTQFGVMEVGKIEAPSAFGRTAMTKYCEKHGEYSPSFCSQLAMGRI